MQVSNRTMLEKNCLSSYLMIDYQISEIIWAEMSWELVPVRNRLGKLVRRGASRGDPKAEALCRNLLKLWPAWFIFASVPGMDHTNNRAARALGDAVLWRKGWFSNQSDNDSRFTERILNTVATFRQQDRNIAEYVVAAIQAHRTGQSVPSVLPMAQLLVEVA
jgi:hypothetical protein